MLFPLWFTLFVVSSSRSMLVQTGVLPELLLLVVVLVLVLLLDAGPPPIPLELDEVVVMPVLVEAELVLVDGLVDPPLELPPLPLLLLPHAAAAINTAPAPPMKRIRRMVLPSVIGCSDPLMRRRLSNVWTTRERLRGSERCTEGCDARRTSPDARRSSRAPRRSVAKAT
jgi:hypothetical protein